MEGVDNFFTAVTGKIDFKNGQIYKRQVNEDKGILDINWKRNVHLIIQILRYNGGCYYFVERNEEQVSCSYYGTKLEDSLFKSIQKLVDKIENGDFDFKKTVSEKIAEIICKRQLTSYMNNTKWKEFLDLMNKYSIPYEYDEADEVYIIYGYK